MCVYSLFPVPPEWTGLITVEVIPVLSYGKKTFSRLLVRATVVCSMLNPHADHLHVNQFRHANILSLVVLHEKLC